MEDGGEDKGGDGQARAGGDGGAGGEGAAQGAAPGALGHLGHLGHLGQWMALMAEHMSQDPARLQFLWPKLLTGTDKE